MFCQFRLLFTGSLKVTYCVKIPFFLFLGAYIRASEVTSRCKTPQKHNPGIYLVPLCLKIPHLTAILILVSKVLAPQIDPASSAKPRPLPSTLLDG